MLSAMPIEFQCPACQTSIRTPDGTQGKPARCPRCGAVVSVPGATAATSAGGQPGESTFPPPPISPFAERETKATPLPAAGPLNPYATPQNIFAEGPFQPSSGPDSTERARWRLIGPAIGMIVFALTGLAFMALVVIALLVDPDRILREVGPDPAERAGAYGFIAAYFSIGLLSRLTQIAGAIAMLRLRGYTLAMAGAISTLIPCEIYCCIPCLPFGIWALIALMNRDVKRAFG